MGLQHGFLKRIVEVSKTVISDKNRKRLQRQYIPFSNRRRAKHGRVPSNFEKEAEKNMPPSDDLLNTEEEKRTSKVKHKI